MRILHPTDFSRTAEKARRLALTLGERLGGDVHIIYAQQRFETEPRRFLQPTPDALNPEAVRRLEEARADEVRRIQERLKNLASEGGSWELRWGNPVTEVLDAAKACDLIVMGAHGANRIDAFFLGGVAGRVVRRTEVPVLTVREECTVENVTSILVATDFGDASKHAWQHLESWVEKGVTLHLAHVIDDPRYHGDADYVRRAEEAMEAMAHGHAASMHVQEGNPIEVLPRLASEVDADAIAVGVRRHTGAIGLLLGSRADALLRSSDVPVLSIPHSDV